MSIFKFYTFIFLVLALGIRVEAQPKISVLEGREIRLDTTAPGILFHAITVKNVGTTVLHLGDVRTSCGCTTVPLSESTVVPNDTAILHVRMDLHDKTGEQGKEIFLVSDDQADSIFQVAFRVFLARDIDPVPMAFPSRLGIKIGKEFETDVDLFNRGSDTIEFHAPHLEADGMECRFGSIDGVRVPPRSSAKLRAFITARSEGYLRGKVYVPSSSRLCPEIAIDLICMASPAH